MSKYTPIIENSQPVAHYNCNDLSGDIVDNINSLDFVDSGLTLYQQPGALIGEPNNKAITLGGLLKTAESLDTTNFTLEFSSEFWINPNTSFSLNIGEQFKFSINDKLEFVFPKKSNWGERGSILQASDLANSDYFGNSCSLSNDGNVLVVGAFYHETTGIDTGAVYTYDRSGNTWIQRGSVLQASDLENSDYFGNSCSLSDDGNVLVVGAHGHETTGTDTGAVYTYDRSGNTWIQRGSVLQASDLVNGDAFGASCSLSNNGNVLVVGAESRTSTGAVYTYDRSGNTWIQRGSVLQASDLATDDYFGVSCSLSNGGNVLVVGAFYHETTGINTGAVYTYDRSGNTWIQRGSVLQASDLATNDNFGASCSLSDDGNVLIVGAHGHETTGTDTGAVYTYDSSGDTWIQRGSILQASDLANGDAFGRSCSLSNNGNVLVVGAYYHETAGTDTGAVYTYDIGSTGKQLTSNEYNHIVLDYEYGNIHIYKNGSLIHTESLYLKFNVTSYIQLLSDSTIDELVIYDRNLSEYEIKSHYYNGLQLDHIEYNVLNSNPLVYLPMDDSYNTMNPKYGTIKGELINNPTLNNIGIHKDCILFDGIDQAARVMVVGDEYFNDVSLLLHMDGINGSNTFVDSSKHELIPDNVGGVSVFNGAASFTNQPSYLKFNSIFDIGYNDFTIEFMMNITTPPIDWINIFSSGNGLWSETSGIQLILNNTLNVFKLKINGIDSGNISVNLTNSVWYNISIVMQRGVLYIYVDGSSVYNNALYTYLKISQLYIGYGDGTSGIENFNGYIDEFRITNGIARYTKDYTPSNTKFSDNLLMTQVKGDEYFDSVSLLLHMDGADNSTSFTDSSKYNSNIGAIGNTKITNIQSVFGQSVYFDGVGDYLNIPRSNRFDFASRDFTIEFNMYAKSYNINTSILWDVDGDDYTGVSIGLNASGYIAIYMTSTGSSWNVVNYQGTLIPINTWVNVAFIRNGNDFTLYLDGIGDFVVNSNANLYYNPAIDLAIGGQSGVNRGFDGYIDEFRVTNGVARYIEDFILPTKPFYNNKPTINYDWSFPIDSDEYFDNVELLLHMDGSVGSNEFIDSSKNVNTVGAFGNVAIRDTQAKFNQAAHFSGDDDHLRPPISITNNMQTNPYVIEMSIYITTNGIHPLFSQSKNQSSGEQHFHVDNGNLIYFRHSSHSGSIYLVETTNNPINLNTWYVVAMAVDSNTTRLYIDGIQVASAATTPNMLWSAVGTNVYIGKLLVNPYPQNRQFFIGYIDEFRLTIGNARYIGNYIPLEHPYPNNNSITGNGLSIECWFNYVSVTGGSYNTIFSKGTELENALTIQDSVFTTTGNISYQVNSNTIVTANNIAIGLSTWNHIVVSIDSNIVSIYLNGDSIGKFPNEVSIFTNKDFHIANDENNVYPSNMYISDFAIHTKALSESEIKGRYNVFNGTKDDTAILYDDYVALLAPTNYYKMDDISTYIEDSIGTAYGTLTGVTNGLQSNSLIPADINNKSIDLTDSYIRFPYTHNYEQMLSISCVVNVHAFQAVTMWLCKGGIEGDGNNPTYIGITDNGGNKFYCYYGNSFYYPSILPVVGETTHIVTTLNGTNVKMYINGVLGLNATIDPTTFGNVTKVSKDVAGLDYFNTDELMVFDGKELSAIEVQNLYTKSQFSDILPDYNTLVAQLIPINYYKFSDNTPTIIDTMGVGDGTIVGSDYIQQTRSLMQYDNVNKSTYIGNNSYISLPDITFSTSEFTLSGLFNIQEISLTSGIAIYRDNNNDTSFYITSVDSQISYYDGVNSFNTGFYLDVNVNYMITCLFTSSDVKLYVNGMHIITITTVPNFITLQHIFSASDYKINVDEVMIFDRLLLDTEILQLYQASMSTLDKDKSFENYIHYSNPSNYYKFSDNTTTIIDTFGTNNGTLSGNTYQQLDNSIILSDISNKSITLKDASITLSSTDSVDVRTIGFFINVLELPILQDISILSGAIKTYAFIDKESHKLGFDNGTSIVYSNFVFDANIIYHVVINYTSTTVQWYINGVLDSESFIDSFVNGSDTIASIGEVAGNVKLDDIIIYNDRNLLDTEIFKIYNLAQYSYGLLVGYKIYGTTQIEGSYRKLDIRLYQHDTGGLVYQSQSDTNGNYSLTGLHNIPYDIVFYEEGVYGTCQEIYMNLFPEIYQY